MSVTIDPADEVRRLGVTLDAFAALRERLGPRAEERAQGVSGWCASQHLYHIALATDLALRNVRVLCTGKGRLIVHEGEPNELALAVFERGGYPRGESEAPRMVQPPDPVEGEYLTMEMEGNRKALAETEALAPQVPAAAGRVPHHALGALDAAQWLLFARLHAGHHLAILEDIEAGLASA